MVITLFLTAALIATAPSSSAEGGLAQAQLGSASPQAPAATFDVISIKPSNPKDLGFTIRPSPNTFAMTGASLKFLVQYAYNIHEFQIEGAPAWMKSARFDITAKMDAPSAEMPRALNLAQGWEAEQKLLEERLRSVLADRFKLRVHRGTKEMPVYGLVIAKSGPKLKASANNTGYTSGPGMFICSDTSMDALASMLSDMVNRTVLDQTKLIGGYAFSLKWAPNDTDNSDLPGLFTAIQEQLGLKLVPTKGPIEVLLIDHVEMPSEN
jgi:uncharacterized protein (TIGR03435 family)